MTRISTTNSYLLTTENHDAQYPLVSRVNPRAAHREILLTGPSEQSRTVRTEEGRASVLR
ncbi:hypothetical protein ACFPRL_09085 [Pseudoclavibacter helvolus]